MALKHKMAVMPGPVPDRDFELLLRRASECLRVNRPRLLGKAIPARRKPAAAS